MIKKSQVRTFWCHTDWVRRLKVDSLDINKSILETAWSVVLSRLEQLLEQVLQGEDGLKLELLRALSAEMLVVPVVSFAHSGEGADTRKVSVFTIVEGGKRVVPAFTSEERFLDWSSAEHQCFSIVGADLGVTLPKETFLLLNPGSPFCLELAPSEVHELAILGDGTESAIEGGEAESEELYIDDLTEDDALEADEGNAENEEVADSSLPLEPMIATEDLLNHITSIISEHPNVLEAYFVPVEEVGHRAPLLGLLVDSIDAEERFEIIGEIAELSRQLYGEAGAIEVYDDLNSQTSSSWDLFYTQVPFYVREPIPVDAPLAEQIAYHVTLDSNVKSDESNLLAGAAAEKAKEKGSLAAQSIAALGKRLFAGIPGRSRRHPEGK